MKKELSVQKLAKIPQRAIRHIMPSVGDLVLTDRHRYAPGDVMWVRYSLDKANWQSVQHGTREVVTSDKKTAKLPLKHGDTGRSPLVAAVPSQLEQVAPHSPHTGPLGSTGLW